MLKSLSTVIYMEYNNVESPKYRNEIEKKQCTFKLPSAVILSLLQLPQKCSLMEVINPN